MTCSAEKRNAQTITNCFIHHKANAVKKIAEEKQDAAKADWMKDQKIWWFACLRLSPQDLRKQDLYTLISDCNVLAKQIKLLPPIAALLRICSMTFFQHISHGEWTKAIAMIIPWKQALDGGLKFNDLTLGRVLAMVRFDDEITGATFH